MKEFAARLADAGMTSRDAVAKARLFERALNAASPQAGRGRPIAVFVPGRVEILGKHTDYAGGRSLLCASARGVCLVACPRPDRLVRVHDIVSRTTAEAIIDGRPAAAPPVGWAVYIATVARRLARNFPQARSGADIAFGSDLPMAAGMSSSSALMTSMLLALSAVNDLPASEAWRANIGSRVDLAEYLGTVENGQDFRALSGDAGVGTFGGSEDHTAMLCCRAGEFSQYSFCPVRHERQIPMPAGYVLAVAVSGVVAEKTGAARAAYNRASLAAREVLDLWNRATGRRDPTLGVAVGSDAGAAGRIRHLLSAAAGHLGEPAAASLRQRFDQFVDESFTIIPEVGDRLAAGRVQEIGELVDRSQAAAERGLRNQVPETSFLARSAREIGAIAASAFGAGFGGGVWALTLRAGAAGFCRRWSQRYAAAFPQHVGRAQFFTTSAGPCAVEMPL